MVHISNLTDLVSNPIVRIHHVKTRLHISNLAAIHPNDSAQFQFRGDPASIFPTPYAISQRANPPESGKYEQR